MDCVLIEKQDRLLPAVERAIRGADRVSLWPDVDRQGRLLFLASATRYGEDWPLILDQRVP